MIFILFHSVFQSLEMEPNCHGTYAMLMLVQNIKEDHLHQLGFNANQIAGTKRTQTTRDSQSWFLSPHCGPGIK